MWHAYRAKEIFPEISEAQQAVFDQGHEVGQLAKCLFPDGVEVAAAAGITAIVAPAGSLRDNKVIERANELGVALFHAPERIFSHH